MDIKIDYDDVNQETSKARLEQYSDAAKTLLNADNKDVHVQNTDTEK